MTAADTAQHVLEPPRCPHCGIVAPGRYCVDCGTQVSSHRDLSVRHFLREAVAAITDLDSVLIRSVRTLFTQPGRLTVEYLRGDRARYLPPFRLFLFCNVVYFIIVANFQFNILTTSMSAQVHDMFYHAVTERVLEQRFHLAPEPTLPDGSRDPRALRDPRRTTIEARFNGATEGIGKVIVVVLIPIYALILLVLYAGTGRYFAEHLVFATHFVAVLLIALPAIGFAFTGYQFLWYYATRTVVGEGEAPFVLSIVLSFALYASLAQRTVYGGSRIATTTRTALLASTVVPIIPVFKFVLFFVTLYWIGS